MSFVFDEKKATNSLGETSWASGDRTGYLENFRASYDAMFASDRFDSERNSVEKEYSLLVDHLNKKGYSQFSNPIYNNEDVPLGPEDPRVLDEPPPSETENIETFWQRIDELKAANPDIAEELTNMGYENQDQFFNTMGVRIQGLHDKQADIADRSTGMGTFGNFAGSFSALVTDPLVLGTLPIGAMYKVPTTALAAAWRVAWVEGLIGTAVEIPIQIKAQGFRKEVGLKTEVELFGKTVNLGVLNTLTVGAGSFVLGGLIQGIIKGVPNATGILRKQLNKSSDEEINKISKALKIENPEELSKVKQPENPFEETKATSQLDTENHNAAQSMVLNDIKKEIKPIEAAIKSKSINEITANNQIYKPEEIEFDPVNFQYKTDGDKRGVSNKLAEVKEWDNVAAGTIMVFEYRNGTKAIVDGHQRLGLAKRLSAQGKKIDLLAYTIREADGITPEAAMIKGLMVNLMNNTGTASDAAKILRSRYGVDFEQIKKFLPPRTNLVRNTFGLTRLSDDAWGMVSNNRQLENLGAKVGEIIEDQSLHANIIKILKDKKFSTVGELEQTLRLTNTLPKTVTKQDTLFGTDFFAETLLVERSQLLNWAKKNITKRSAAFKTIVENDTTLQKAGNKLNKLNNEEQRLIYEQVGERFEQIATRAGAELSDKLTKAAQLLKDGKRGDAEKFFQQAIDDAAAKGDFRGSDVSQSFGANKTEIETPTIPTKFEEDLKTDKLFSDPKVGQASEDPSIADEILGEGISKEIKDDVGSGGSVSTSPAVKSLSITQDLAAGSQRTKATPPSSVFADATASPPSLRGSDNNIVGSTSAISKRIIYHSINDINELKALAKKNYDGYLAFLNKFKEKHKANIDISIKDDASLAEKLKTRNIEEVSDLLRARIDVDTIDQARAVAQDIKNTVKAIEFDDFLKTENGRGSGYRGIHVQLLTKDGMTAELQIRLKSTASILTRSHKLYKMKASEFKTAKGLAAFEKAKENIRMELDDAWFSALEKQGLGSEELIDAKIHTGTYIDGAGEEIDIVKPMREFLEDDAKAAQALERLKDCK
jgi:ppGpp synthetase/RelA/SpoT-type nucleotidyltranferase